MRQISNNINYIVKGVFSKKGISFAEIMMHWSNIVGNELAENISPVKVTMSKVGKKEIKILHVLVPSASAGVEVSYKQDMIIERIAAFFGYKAIDKLKINIA